MFLIPTTSLILISLSSQPSHVIPHSTPTPPPRAQVYCCPPCLLHPSPLPPSHLPTTAPSPRVPTSATSPPRCRVHKTHTSHEEGGEQGCRAPRVEEATPGEEEVARRIGRDCHTEGRRVPPGPASTPPWDPTPRRRRPPSHIVPTRPASTPSPDTA
jgi:hypothetical protein